jgi:PAS domain S-box-containing protein
MRVHSSRTEVLVTSQTEGNPYKPKEMADLNTGLYCETVMANRRLLYVPNALEDKEWKDNPDVKLDMISYLGLPLVWPDGSIFGTICVLDKKPRDYSRDYIDLLRQFKDIIESDFKILVSQEKVKVQRKRAKEKLKTSELKLSKVFLQSPNSITLTTLEDGRFIEVNQGFLRISGYTREEVIGKSSLEIGIWKNYPERRIMTKELREKGRIQSMEIDYVDKNGKVVTCLTSGELIELDGKPHLMLIASDITHRKKADKALRESENRYRALFENATDAIFLMEGDRFMDCNPRTLEIFRAAREQIINHTPFDFSPPTQPDGRDSSESAREKIDKAYKGIPQSFEWEHLTPDGTSFFVEVHLNRLVLSTGMYLLAILRDITERKQAEEKEKQYQEQLMQADKMVALGTLVSGVAHEINNPNNAIMFNAPLLKEIFDEIIPIMDERYQQEGDFELSGFPYSQLKQSVNELLNGIIRSSDRMKVIVADLKSFARPESYDMNQEVNINKVALKSLTLLQSMIKKSTSNFSVNYGKNIPPVTGNFQQLEQVVINLVQNACQALENNRQAIGVSISYDKKNQQVKVKVEDEGVGIDPDDIKFITDPFFTTRREQGGTGLGLSVSARIIRDHGGTLHIESQPGLGSVFIVTLPARKSEPLL